MPKPISESATGRCRWESETISWVSKHDDKQNQLWNKICIARTDKWALTLLGYLNILFINNSVNNAKLECEMPLYRLLSWRPQTMHLLNLNVYRFKALPEALPHFLVKHEVDSSCDVYEPRNHEISLYLLIRYLHYMKRLTAKMFWTKQLYSVHGPDEILRAMKIPVIEEN